MTPQQLPPSLGPRPHEMGQTAPPQVERPPDLPSTCHTGNLSSDTA